MASAGPSPDLMAVLNLVPECARSCMREAIDICTPQDVVSKCILAACTVRELLSTQNITMTSCGVTAKVDQTYIPIYVLFMVLAILAAAMRFATRFFTSRGMDSWDDWFLALALAGCVGYSAIGLEGAHRGLGAEMWSVSPDNITHLFAGFYASMLIYAVSRLFLRHSILLFYLRIFTIGNPRPVIMGTMAVNTLLSLAVAFSMAFQCQPVSLFWARWDGAHEGHCLPTTSVFWGGAIASMVMDVWVILLPLPYVARLQLSLKKRLGISLMLAIGIGVITFSILKSLAARNFEHLQNPTGKFATIGLWSALEIDLGIICACLPGMRLLVGYCMTQWGWKTHPVSRQSRHLSFHNNLGSSVRKGTPGGSTTEGSTHESTRGWNAKIRITTTIQIKELQSESQTYLPLGDKPHGVVRSHAWA